MMDNTSLFKSRPSDEAHGFREQLKHHPIYFRVFMDAADPIIIEDLSGIVIDANREALRAYGWTREELLGQPITSIVPEERHGQAAELLKHCLAGEEVRNVEGLRVSREGTVYDVLLTLSLLKDENGKPVAIASIAKDITQLRQSEAATKRMSLVFMDASDPIVIEDLSGIVIDANREALRAYGWTREELLGQPITSIVPEERHGQAGELLKHCRAGEEVRNVEGLRVSREGTVYEVLLTLSLLKDERGKPVAIASIAKDITHLRLREEAEKANQAKRDFLANMSHEIRTPMNAIIGMSQLALNTQLTPKQHNYLSQINVSGKILLDIINDILDFSKIEAGKLDLEIIEFQMAEVLANLSTFIMMKAQEKGLEVLFSMNKDVPTTLMGDPLRLGQVLVNLASNAVKFTEQGEVIIFIEQVSQEDNKATLQFSVKDTGIGLSQEQMGRLFQAFNQGDTSTTRKYGGTGLGLTICQRLVELMDGKLWIESELGQGSRFSFTASFGLPSKERGKELASAIDLRGVRALVVDDNETSRKILERILKSYSLDISLAGSGQEALAELERVGSEKRYELVIMDRNMPGMDGLEAVNRIRAHPNILKQPKIIMLTAYGQEEVWNRANQAGLDGFLIKPVNPSMMLDVIMEVLGKKAVEPHRLIGKLDVEVGVLKSIQGAQVLLVEDNAINQEVAVAMLEQAGLVVSIAHNGKEAIRKVSESEYDCLLMDIQMPDLDGLETTRRIRQQDRFQSLPIIAMTANAMAGDRDRCLAEGMNDYVTKPIDPNKLFSTLRHWIKRPKQPSPSPSFSSREAEEREDDPIWTNLPGIDVPLGLERVGGNKTLYRKLLMNFHRDYIDATTLINADLDGGDTHNAEMLVHTIKGIAGNLGAEDLHTLAGKLESAIRNGTHDRSPQLQEDFARCLGTIMISLAALKSPEDNQKGEESEFSGKPTGSFKALFQSLKNLETHLKDGKPKQCAQAIKHVRQLAWPSDFEQSIKELEMLLRRYKFQDARPILDSLIRKLSCRPIDD